MYWISFFKSNNEEPRFCRTEQVVVGCRRICQYPTAGYQRDQAGYQREQKQQGVNGIDASASIQQHSINGINSLVSTGSSGAALLQAVPRYLSSSPLLSIQVLRRPASLKLCYTNSRQTPPSWCRRHPRITLLLDVVAWYFVNLFFGCGLLKHGMPPHNPHPQPDGTRGHLHTSRGMFSVVVGC